MVHILLSLCVIVAFIVINTLIPNKSIGNFIVGNISIFFLCVIFYFMFFEAIKPFIWNNIITRKYDIRDKRIVHSYNLCLKHIENKDLEKASTVFVNAFKGKNNWYEQILRVAIKTANNLSLGDEHLNL